MHRQRRAVLRAIRRPIAAGGAVRAPCVGMSARAERWSHDAQRARRARWRSPVDHAKWRHRGVAPGLSAVESLASSGSRRARRVLEHASTGDVLVGAMDARTARVSRSPSPSIFSSTAYRAPHQPAARRSATAARRHQHGSVDCYFSHRPTEPPRRWTMAREFGKNGVDLAVGGGSRSPSRRPRSAGSGSGAPCSTASRYVISDVARDHLIAAGRIAKRSGSRAPRQSAADAPIPSRESFGLHRGLVGSTARRRDAHTPRTTEAMLRRPLFDSTMRECAPHAAWPVPGLGAHAARRRPALPRKRRQFHQPTEKIKSQRASAPPLPRSKEHPCAPVAERAAPPRTAPRTASITQAANG